MRKLIPWLLGVLVLTATVPQTLYLWDRISRVERAAALQARVQSLRVLVEQREAELTRQTVEYQSSSGAIDDLSLDAAALLRGLPAVVAATSNSVKDPARCIIHVLDWHYISRERFAAGHPDILAEHLDLEYDANQLEVDLVQVEQVAALTCLAKHHGLQAIWCESLVPENVAGWLEEMEQMKKVDAVVPKLKQGGRHEELLWKYRKAAVQNFGAAGKLYRAGLIQEMLAPEDFELNAKCHANLTLENMKARDKFMIQQMLAHASKCQLIILGGAHDFSDNVPAGVEYIRLTVSAYLQARRWQGNLE